jgi:hypothetical protein
MGSAFIRIPNNANAELGESLTINSLAANSSVQINTDWSDPWTFGSDGNLTLPQGSVIGETATTTVISPPGAAAGQSLVIRPTTSAWSVTASGNIVYGNSITISVTQNSPEDGYFGTINYEITGTGLTSQTLGRALTGKVVFSGPGPETETVTWTIPANSTISEFTFTLTTPDGTESTGPGETDPALYYSFSNNGMPAGYLVNVTNNGISNNDASHVHLVAGDPTTTDIYLGDDDQYVKIEKNGGNVVIGTDANTNHWTFDTNGVLTFPGGDMSIGNSNGSEGIFGSANAQIGILSQGSSGAATLQWIDDPEDPTAVAAVVVNSLFANIGDIQIVTGNIGNIGNVGPTLEHSWTFNNTGGLVFPDNTVQTTAYRNIAQDNLMLDGGAAATIYEVTVNYAEGGFSSTRYGVNTPSFNGGSADLDEPVQYTLDGGGA